MSATVKKPVVFEQIMLQQAFSYIIDHQVENTDKIIRSLKGVLVMKKVRVKFTDSHEDMMARLEELEAKPVPGIKKDIYSTCDLLRTGTHTVQIWENHRPVGTMNAKAIKTRLRIIMDELNAMSGTLCEALEIEPFDINSLKRSMMIPAGRRKLDGA